MEIMGLLTYAITAMTMAGIYGILVLGLNLQWGFTGLFNIGVAGFFAVGAYSQALMTSGGVPMPIEGPVILGYVMAVVMSGIVALLIGMVTIRLRTDYLAIASIGIAEIIRITIKNEEWLTEGVRGVAGIPRPFDETLGSSHLFMFAIVMAGLGLAYWLVERARVSPWGRVVRAIRENEPAAMASGKNVEAFRLQSFIVGAMIMGLAGAFYAQYTRFISPENFDPLYGTFIAWVMLIAGGSGNNKGAVLGAFVIWFVWSSTEFVLNLLPAEHVTQGGALRVLLIGLLLQVILLFRSEGLLPEVSAAAHHRRMPVQPTDDDRPEDEDEEKS